MLIILTDDLPYCEEVDRQKLSTSALKSEGEKMRSILVDMKDWSYRIPDLEALLLINIDLSKIRDMARKFVATDGGPLYKNACWIHNKTQQEKN